MNLKHFLKPSIQYHYTWARLMLVPLWKDSARQFDAEIAPSITCLLEYVQARHRPGHASVKFLACPNDTIQSYGYYL